MIPFINKLEFDQNVLRGNDMISLEILRMKFVNTVRDYSLYTLFFRT